MSERRSSRDETARRAGKESGDRSNRGQPAAGGEHRRGARQRASGVVRPVRIAGGGNEKDRRANADLSSIPSGTG
jgi:hypothetical protein